MIHISFDIGGTFTDFAVRDPRDGTVRVWKVPTTTSAPEKAVIESLTRLKEKSELDTDAVSAVFHATTIATNALLERKGSRVALVVTKGFRDILLIGRQKRYDTNDMYMDKLAPLVRRSDTYEIEERMAADGSVVLAIDECAARKLVNRIANEQYDAVAIALLHSYVNPAHERRLGAIFAEELSGTLISLSSDVSPKFREYERTSTTVANAYVAPIVNAYLASLGDSLTRLGIGAKLSIMQSNGGLVTSEVACSYPIRIVESGPAAGVLMCAEIGREEGIGDVITFDMGGTTAKLGAIDRGVPAISPTFEVDTVNFKKGSGLPLNISGIELLEIGAGGGSVARTKMGLITVGPDSAGAEPGPICYGRGGKNVTITDANLVLGYLNPDYFNGGAMHLSAGASDAIECQIGRPLGLSIEKAAWGIHCIANANMERAMRVVSIEKGRDPRKYALVAFGGAGPLHAARIARSLEIPKVIVPRGAGVGSALGLLVAKPKIDVALTRVLRLEPDVDSAIADVFNQLEELARLRVASLRESGTLVIERSASIHYVGQGYELRVDLPAGPITVGYEASVRNAFSAAYKREYGYFEPDIAIEVTEWCVTATIDRGHPSFSMKFEKMSLAKDPVVGERAAYFSEAGGMTPTKVVNRYALMAGHRIAGPALVEERESTTVVLPGDTIAISPSGNLIIEIGKVG
jgi:N-methylhydantoinase A